MKRWTWLSLLLITIGLAIGPAATDAAAEARRLCILYNSAVHAELHDCGCKSKPLGGLARRAALIETVRAEGNPVLLLDGGNLLDSPRVESLDKSHLMAQVTADLGYEVVGIGPWDIAHGVDALREIAAQSGLGFVSANLYVDDVLLTDAYHIIEIDGLRVGITSVMDPGLLVTPWNDAAPELSAADPVTSVREILPTLRERSDLVVLYANFDRGGTQSFLQRLGSDAVDVAVEGYATVHYPALRRVGDTILVAANARGKYLGQLDLQVEQATGQLDATVTLHELSLDLDEDPAVAARVTAFEEEAAPAAQSR